MLHFVKIMGLLRFPKTYSGKNPSKTLRNTNIIFVGGILPTKTANNPDRFGGIKISALFSKKSVFFQTYVCFSKTLRIIVIPRAS